MPATTAKSVSAWRSSFLNPGTGAAFTLAILVVITVTVAVASSALEMSRFV